MRCPVLHCALLRWTRSSGTLVDLPPSTPPPKVAFVADLKSLTIDRSAQTPKKRRRAGRSNPWIFRGIVLLVLAGLGFFFQRPIRQFLDRLNLPTVQVAVVRETHPALVGAVQGTTANGYIVAFRRAALSADTPGRIVELNVAEGSEMKKGEVVARLYSAEYEAAFSRAKADELAAKAEVRQAEATMSAAGADANRRARNEQAAEAQVREFEAAHRLTTLRFDRIRKLVDQGVRSGDALDEAKANVETALARVHSARSRQAAAVADVADSEHKQKVALAAIEVANARVEVAKFAKEQAQATLDKTNVRAPFDGIVVLKDAEVGEVVSPNSQGGSNARGSVCTMVDFNTLEVQADLPETSLPSVQLGAKAAIYLDAYPDRTYEGKVSRIWPTADRQKGSIEIRVVFVKRDKDLRPDMAVRVVFLRDSEAAVDTSKKDPVILIPEDAVVRMDGKPGAFLLERDTVRFQPIEIGKRAAGQITVKSGLQSGQRIVLAPPADLTSGSRVQAATN